MWIPLICKKMKNMTRNKNIRIFWVQLIFEDLWRKKAEDMISSYEEMFKREDNKLKMIYNA